MVGSSKVTLPNTVFGEMMKLLHIKTVYTLVNSGTLNYGVSQTSKQH